MNNYKNWLRAGAVASTVLAGATIANAESGSESPAQGSSINAAYVAVDFGDRQGALLRTERYNTWDNDDAASELRADSVQFLNEQGLHAEMYRIGFKIDELCVVMTNECDFSSIASWIDDVSDATESLVVHLGPNAMISEGRPIHEIKALLRLTISELKQRFPKIDYIESINEPDWILNGSLVRRGADAIVQPDNLYDYYVPYYEAVNEVNEELGLRPWEHIQVGGPTLTGLNETWITAFLDDYAADTNPEKRLDFISYHGYGVFSDDFQDYHLYKSNPSEVATQRERLEGWLKERHISKHIPTFVTETGIYPFSLGDNYADPTQDAIRQAAGMASLHYWFADQPRTIPFHWTVRHGYAERKDQLVTRGPAGPLADTFTPYGNMMLMQSMMKDTRVSATSDSLAAGQGVYAIASKDRTGASIMVWNYQGANEGRFATTIDMSRLPASLKRGQVRQTTYRIDQNTSNYWTNPEQGNLQKVDEQIVNLRRNCCSIVDLEPNALVLIILEPVGEHHGRPGNGRWNTRPWGITDGSN